MSQEASDIITQPVAIDDATLAFPHSVIGKLLPEWDVIPDEFKSHHHKYAELARKWMYQGIKAIRFNPEIDAHTAGRHIQACLGSYEPKFQHKIAGVAYLMSIWGAEEIDI